MRVTQMKKLSCLTRAFTLIESLLVLFIVSFCIIAFQFSCSTVLETIEEKIFYLSFEHFYMEEQELAVVKQEERTIRFENNQIVGKDVRLPIPRGTTGPDHVTLTFNKEGRERSVQTLL